ncbi:hypothetical protein GCM10027075_74930 [Streptomyces heilongjiangensis]
MDHEVSCRIQPIRYDLTPFAGLLGDGRPHRVEGSVVGVPEGQSGWSTPVNVLVRQDGKSAHVTGALTEVRAGDLATPSTRTPATEHRLDTEGSHRLTVAGFVDTSHGRVTTTVRRSLPGTFVHTWSDGENPDALDARWSDETVTVDGRGPARTTRAQRSYTRDPTTTLGAGDRPRTVLMLGDRPTAAETHGAGRTSWSRLDDTYTGDATYTAFVPRDRRHAAGPTSERLACTGRAAATTERWSRCGEY